MNLDLKILKGIIPYLGGFLMVCGYLKFSFYYMHFNIKILKYIELTDILTLFLDDTILISFTFLSAVFMLFLIFLDFPEAILPLDKKNEEEVTNDKVPLKSSNHFKEILILGVSIALLNSGLLVLSCFNPKYHPFFKVITIFLMLFFIFMIIAIEFKKDHGKLYEKINKTYMYVAFLSFIFISSTLSICMIDIISTEENKKFIAFTYSGKSVKSTCDILYVGETKEYLFLYDKKIKTASVYPRKDISDFTIKRID